jgi:hypothetical protein
VISKCSGEDQDHGELEEGLVGVGFAVAAGRDSASVAEPGVGAFDRPALARKRIGGLEPALAATPDLAGWGVGGDRLAWLAGLADPGRDLAFA